MQTQLFARPLPGQQLGIVAEIAWLSFTVKWTTPIWETLGFGPATEATQILEHARKLLRAFGADLDPVQDVSDAAFAAMAQSPDLEPHWRWLGWALAAAGEAAAEIAPWGHAPWAALVLASAASRVARQRTASASDGSPEGLQAAAEAGAEGFQLPQDSGASEDAEDR